MNLRTRRLTGLDGKRVELTNGEFSLLEAFCAAPQRVLSREQLLDLSRLHNAEVYDRSIDVQILRLRRKIEMDPSRPEYIKTERGAGYYVRHAGRRPVLRAVGTAWADGFARANTGRVLTSDSPEARVLAIELSPVALHLQASPATSVIREDESETVGAAPERCNE